MYLLSFLWSNDVAEIWDIGSSSLRDLLRSNNRTEFGWNHWNMFGSFIRIVIYIMYVSIECFVVCLLEIKYQISFVTSFYGRSTYMISHCVGLGVWGIMNESDIWLIYFIDSSPVSCWAEM